MENQKGKKRKKELERKRKNEKKRKEKKHTGRADFLKLAFVMRFLMLFRCFLDIVLCFACKLLSFDFLDVLKALF